MKFEPNKKGMKKLQDEANKQLGKKIPLNINPNDAESKQISYIQKQHKDAGYPISSSDARAVLKAWKKKM